MSAEICPRCHAGVTVTDYEARVAGQIVWTIFRCGKCAFSWRSSEPETTIGLDRRDRRFGVDADRPESYAVVLPPSS